MSLNQLTLQLSRPLSDFTRSGTDPMFCMRSNLQCPPLYVRQDTRETTYSVWSEGCTVFLIADPLRIFTPWARAPRNICVASTSSSLQRTSVIVARRESIQDQLGNLSQNWCPDWILPLQARLCVLCFHNCSGSVSSQREVIEDAWARSSSLAGLVSDAS